MDDKDTFSPKIAAELFKKVEGHRESWFKLALTVLGKIQQDLAKDNDLVEAAHAIEAAMMIGYKDGQEDLEKEQDAKKAN